MKYHIQYSHPDLNKLKPAAGLSVTSVNPKPNILKASPPSFNIKSHNSEPKNRQNFQKTPLPIRYQPYSSPRNSPPMKSKIQNSLEVDPLNISGYPPENLENSDEFPVFEAVPVIDNTKKATEEIINQENSVKSAASKQKKLVKTHEEDPFSEDTLSDKEIFNENFEKDIGNLNLRLKNIVPVDAKYWKVFLSLDQYY